MFLYHSIALEQLYNLFFESENIRLSDHPQIKFEVRRLFDIWFLLVDV